MAAAAVVVHAIVAGENHTVAAAVAARFPASAVLPLPTYFPHILEAMAAVTVQNIL